jgi:hypothetical protein
MNIQISNFHPERRQILSRIEDLITRDYIRRDATRPNDMFHYVA